MNVVEVNVKLPEGIFENIKMKRYSTKNFTFEELEYSDTANRLNINNTIPEELEDNARRLLDFLQAIREKWGSPIRINSGYRCPKLNKAVGGAKTSAHIYCNAADLFPINGRFAEFKKFLIEYIKDKSWDQCILESSGKPGTPNYVEWVHLSLYNNSGKQRKQIFSLEQ